MTPEETEADDEMRPCYDFSKGVRGRVRPKTLRIMTPEQITEAWHEVAAHDDHLLADYLKLALEEIKRLKEELRIEKAAGEAYRKEANRMKTCKACGADPGQECEDECFCK